MPLILQDYLLFQHIALLIQYLVVLQRAIHTGNHVKYTGNLHAN